MKNLLLILATIFTLTAKAQTSVYRFQKAYGTIDCEDHNNTEQTHNGYISAGAISVAPFTTSKGYLLKTNFIGDILWAKTFSTSSKVIFEHALEAKDSGFIVMGVLGDQPTHEIILMKTDSIGNAIWTKTYGGSSEDFGQQLIATTDGYVIYGSTTSFGSGGTDLYLIKTDFLGNIIWSHTYGGSGFEIRGSIMQTSDSGFVMAGGTNSFGLTSNQVYLVKTDFNGNVLWSRIYGGVAWVNHDVNAVESPDGGYYVVGNSVIGPSTSNNIYIIKTNSMGDTLWTKIYGIPTTSYLFSFSVAIASDHNCVISGSQEPTPGQYNGFLFKIDTAGNVVWSYEFPSAESLDDIHKTNDNGFILTSTAVATFSNGCNDFHLIKADSLGNSGCYQTPSSLSIAYSSNAIIYPNTLSNTGGNEINILLTANIVTPQELVICIDSTTSISEFVSENKINIYPNPFHSCTTIELKSNFEKAELIIYNSLGEQVRSQKLISEKTTINRDQLVNGIYFYQVKNKREILTSGTLIIE